MRLSKNFTLDELIHSNTGERLNINNNPNQEIIDSLTLLVKEVLQPLRDGIGSFINVSSGYRCLKLNTLLGGSKTSQHMKGEAVDIKGKNNKLIFDYIKENLIFDQLIWEFGGKWIHVSFSENNRGEVLESYKENGKIKYKYI